MSESKLPFLKHNIFFDKLVTKNGLRKVLTNFANDTTQSMKEQWSSIQVVELNNILYSQLYKLKTVCLDRKGEASFEVSIYDFPKSEKLHSIGKKLVKVEVSVNEKNWKEVEAVDSLHLDFNDKSDFNPKHGDIVFIRYTYEDLVANLAYGEAENNENTFTQKKYKLNDKITISNYFPYERESSDLYDYVLFKGEIVYKTLSYFEHFYITEDLLENNLTLKKIQKKKWLEVNIDNHKNEFLFDIAAAEDAYGDNENDVFVSNTDVKNVYKLIRERYNIQDFFEHRDWNASVEDDKERTRINLRKKIYHYAVNYDTSHLSGLAEKPRSFVLTNNDRNYLQAIDGEVSDVFRTWAALYLAIKYPELYTYQECALDEEKLTYNYLFEFYESRNQYYQVKRDLALEEARQLFYKQFEYNKAEGVLTQFKNDGRYQPEAETDQLLDKWIAGIKNFIKYRNNIMKAISERKWAYAVELCNEYLEKYTDEFDAGHVITNAKENISAYEAVLTLMESKEKIGNVEDALSVANEYIEKNTDYNDYIKEEKIPKYERYLKYKKSVEEAFDKFSPDNAKDIAVEYLATALPDYGKYFETTKSNVLMFNSAKTSIEEYREDVKVEEGIEFINNYINDNKPDYRIDDSYEETYVQHMKILFDKFIALQTSVDNELNKISEDKTLDEIIEIVDVAKNLIMDSEDFITLSVFSGYFQKKHDELAGIKSFTYDARKLAKEGKYTEAFEVYDTFIAGASKYESDFITDYFNKVKSERDKLQAFIDEIYTLDTDEKYTPQNYAASREEINRYLSNGGIDFNDEIAFRKWRCDIDQFVNDGPIIEQPELTWYNIVISGNKRLVDTYNVTLRFIDAYGKVPTTGDWDVDKDTRQRTVYGNPNGIATIVWAALNR